MPEQIILKKRAGDDIKVISMRLPSVLLKKIDDAAEEANCSRNDVLLLLLEHGIDKLKIEE